MLQQAASIFALNPDAIAGLTSLRGGESPQLEAETLFSRVLDLIARAADRCVVLIQEAT
jgi:hypothetical protein